MSKQCSIYQYSRFRQIFTPFLGLLISLLTGPLRAQEYIQSKTYPAQATLETIQGVKVLKFKDGREATFVQQTAKPTETRMEMKQIENTCQEKAIMASCRLTLNISPLEYSIRWSKHPDRTKIGQIVVVKRFYGDQPEASETQVLSSDEFLFWYNSQLLRNTPIIFPNDRIVCSSLDWTSDMRTENGLKIVDSWAGEIMQENRETGVNENRTANAMFGAKFKVLNKNTIILVGFDSSTERASIPPYISLQVMNFSYINTEGKTCQAAFAIDGSELIKVIGAEDFKKTDVTTRRIPEQVISNGDTLIAYGISLLTTESTERAIAE